MAEAVNPESKVDTSKVSEDDVESEGSANSMDKTGSTIGSEIQPPLTAVTTPDVDDGVDPKLSAATAQGEATLALDNTDKVSKTDIPLRQTLPDAIPDARTRASIVPPSSKSESDDDTDDSRRRYSLVRKAKKSKQQGRKTISEFSGFLEQVDKRINQLESDSVKLSKQLDDLYVNGLKKSDETSSNDNNEDNDLNSNADDVAKDGDKEKSKEEIVTEVKIFASKEEAEFSKAADKYVIRALRVAEGEKLAENVTSPLEASVVDTDFSKLSINSTPLAYLLKSVTGGDLDVYSCLSKLDNLTPPFRLLHRARAVILQQIDTLKNEFEVKTSDNNVGGTNISVETQELSPVREDGENEQDSSQDVDAKRKQGKERDSHETQEALEHFRLIIKFMDDHLPRTTKKYKGLRSGKEKMVEFGDLWMLFEVGDLIYAPSRRGVKIEVDGEKWGAIKVYTSQAFRVLGAFGAVGDKFMIREYDGEMPISSLEVHPVNTCLDPKMKEKLLIRGGRFVDFSKISHRFYEGLTVGQTREEITSQVMVDLALALQQDSSLMPNFAWPSSSPIPKKLKKLLGEDVILLPGVVPAFALHNRKWVALDIDLTKEVKFEDNSFNELILPDGHRNLVLSLVCNHNSRPKSTQTKEAKIEASHDRADVVMGKGKGRVILLHGAPGVGKTSTAECVAAYTGRPLFPVTCGDIGYDSQQVERNLTENFTMAHRWGCVMLLDEADVFMARRSKEDLKRNGLVSVFLRILEYYSGILFLTTNRVGVFDDAFKSRIHLSLYYPALDAVSTEKVWAMNLRRTKQNKPNYDIKDDKIMEFAKRNFDTLKWNGRQIRNAFQTAIALAEFDANGKKQKPTISADQFSIVAKASLEFDLYLIKTHKNTDESFRAQKDSTRWDEDEKLQIPSLYVPPPTPPPRARSPELSDASSSDSGSSDDSDSDSDSDSERKARKERKEKKKAKKKAKKLAKKLKKEKKRAEKATSKLMLDEM